MSGTAHMSQIVYKLVRPDLTTYGGCQWVVGAWRETDGRGELCGPGWIHAYPSVELAVLLNPIHANFDSCVLYRAEAAGARKEDHGLKLGVTRLRLLEAVPLPLYTVAQRVAFGLLCARAVYAEPTWQAWAAAWAAAAAAGNLDVQAVARHAHESA